MIAFQGLSPLLLAVAARAQGVLPGFLASQIMLHGDFEMSDFGIALSF